MKNYNFMGFYFGKERCHLQSEVIKVTVIKDFRLGKFSIEVQKSEGVSGLIIYT